MVYKKCILFFQSVVACSSVPEEMSCAANMREAFCDIEEKSLTKQQKEDFLFLKECFGKTVSQINNPYFCIKPLKYKMKEECFDELLTFEGTFLSNPNCVANCKRLYNLVLCVKENINRDKLSSLLLKDARSPVVTKRVPDRNGFPLWGHRHNDVRKLFRSENAFQKEESSLNEDFKFRMIFGLLFRNLNSPDEGELLELLGV